MYNMKLVFSRGLGALPVSLEVDITKPLRLDGGLWALYDDIASFGHPDVLFKGEIGGSNGVLEWVVPRLKNEGVFVSIMFAGTYSNINPHRYIVTFSIVNSTTHSLIEGLTESDILLFNGDNVGMLKRMRSLLIKHEVNCKLMFDTDTLSEDEVLANKIIDVHPY